MYASGMNVTPIEDDDDDSIEATLAMLMGGPAPVRARVVIREALPPPKIVDPSLCMVCGAAPHTISRTCRICKGTDHICSGCAGEGIGEVIRRNTAHTAKQKLESGWNCPGFQPVSDQSVESQSSSSTKSQTEASSTS